jgi:hypothetical protein
MLQNLDPGSAGEHRTYLDLYGSPSPNQSWNERHPHARIETNVFAWSAKDEERAAEKWGKEFYDHKGTKTRRYYEADLRTLEGKDEAANTPHISEFDRVFSIHSIYYFDPRSICDLVNSMGRRKILECVVHRFEGPVSGTINAGEQKWEKVWMHENPKQQVADKYVKQTNVRTGETYSHYDNSWMFEGGNLWSNGEKGDSKASCMTWTVNKMSTDTYRVKFVMITPAQHSMGIDQGGSQPISPMAAPRTQRIRTAPRKAAAMKEDGGVTFNIGSNTMEFPIPMGALGIVDKLRIKMAHVPRTPKRFRDHVARVKREVLALKDGGVGADDISDIALATFWMDFEKEFHAMDGAGVEAYKASVLSDDVYMRGELGGAKAAFDHVLHATEVILSAKSVKHGAVSAVGMFRSYLSKGDK